MILRREQHALEADKIIGVIDLYGDKFYIDRAAYLAGHRPLIGIYRKYKGKFWRDKNELCLHRENILASFLNEGCLPLCGGYSKLLAQAEKFTGEDKETLRNKYGLFTIKEWGHLIKKMQRSKKQ